MPILPLLIGSFNEENVNTQRKDTTREQEAIRMPTQMWEYVFSNVALYMRSQPLRCLHHLPVSYSIVLFIGFNVDIVLYPGATL